MHILVINPGSTSTKMAVYRDRTCLFATTITHTAAELAQFANVHQQDGYRRDLVLRELRAQGIDLRFDAVIGRGGIGRPVPGGAYEVNDLMVADSLHATYRHACNLGCVIARDIAARIPGCRALVADPGVVDELMPVARLSGLPQQPRSCVWHALNQRAVARRYARETGRRYQDLRLIVCHLGGGISVAAHDHGLAVDVNNAISGEGPFSTERSGSLPTADVVRLCFSGRHTEAELLDMVNGGGGMAAHLGTNDLREAMRRVDRGDAHARLVVEAMAYNVAKWICALAAALCGQVDAILVTGGMAHSEPFVNLLRRRVEFLAPLHCYPGEDELDALAEDALAVLRGEMEAKTYGPFATGEDEKMKE